MSEDTLRFPIGEFTMPGPLDPATREEAINAIETLPTELRDAVDGLSDEQLDTPYRPGGWTPRQVVHHVPESHMTSFGRLKFALTLDKPTVYTYDEAAWALLPDAAGPLEMSLGILDALHTRWVYLFRSLNDAQWERTFIHPDLGEMRVDELLAFYAWHGKHHVAHITELRKRNDW